MALTKALRLMVSFLTVHRINATITSIPTPTFKPIIVTMHGGPKVTVTQQRELVTYGLPIFTICQAHVESNVGSNQNESCFTSYYPTTTRICSTTLSPLAAPLIPITACDQNVTFSTDHGFKVTPTSKAQVPQALQLQKEELTTSSVEKLTTYYAAPWTDLSAGAVPTGPVEAVICSAGGCTTRMERWGTEAREIILTSTQTMQFQAQVTGPANVVVGLNATTIAISAVNGTRISYSAALRTTQTSTSTQIVKSAISEGLAAPAASVAPPADPTISIPPPSPPTISLIPPAAAQGGGGASVKTTTTTTVNETITIRSTSTTTITVLEASAGISIGVNGTGVFR